MRRRMDKERKLERLMRSYHVPPARGDLAGRIISAASGVPQRRGILRWVFGVFLSPVPAFCLAMFLAAGFLAGLADYGGGDSRAVPESAVEQLLGEEDGLL